MVNAIWFAYVPELLDSPYFGEKLLVWELIGVLGDKDVGCEVKS